MTIIAYDGKRLCADKAVYKGAIHIYNREKIRAFDNDSNDNFSVAFALSGDLSAIEGKEEEIEYYLRTMTIRDMSKIVQRLNEIMHDPDNILDGIIVFRVGNRKTVYQLNNVRLLELPANQPYAAGNPDGQMVSMGAMYHGASATEAVAIACRLLNLAQCNDPDNDLTTVSM